tara:strand:+ start:1486 stop:2526 length:1041 start_codon:yes stop_codon:yes gene_type:complete
MYYHNFDEFKTDVFNNAKNRVDRLIPLNSISLNSRGNTFINGELYLTDNSFHNHLAQRLDIPIQYYRKMREEARDLLQASVNTWIDKQDYKKQVLLRSYEKTKESKYRFLNWNSTVKKARGLVSNRYKIMDNAEILEGLQYMIDDTDVVSCYNSSEITQIKMTFPRLEAEIRKGDIVKGGLVLRNSELGFSSITATAFIYRLACLNGMVMPNVLAVNRKYHIGKKISDISYELPEELISQLAGMILDLQNQTNFSKTINGLKNATIMKIQKMDYVRLQNDWNITQVESDAIKENLEAEGDMSKYGLIQAITATAKKINNIQRNIHLERVGGKLLSMPMQQWSELAS